jgi:LPS-assembly lipoprotein
VKRLLPLALLLALGGCGLHPLYAGGENGTVARTLAGVEVGEIGGRDGWLLRNALTDRLAADGHDTPRYRLEVELDDKIQGFGIRLDSSVTRERRTLRARFRLVQISDSTVVLDATAGSDAGIDVVKSEYAVIAAEQTALENLSQQVADQIVARVALFAQRSGNPHAR